MISHIIYRMVWTRKMDESGEGEGRDAGGDGWPGEETCTGIRSAFRRRERMKAVLRRASTAEGQRLRDTPDRNGAGTE
jgi:hypothetical protein